MKKISEPIVFFGSGPVAAKSLELLSQDIAIEAVVTKPQPAHHRGAFPVLKTSRALGLPVITVSSRAELSAVFSRNPVSSRLGIVIDFGIIIGRDVIDSFPLGIVNSHFSLLPKWRGADPISFAILSGDTQTGVSLMLIVEKLDEGPLLAQSSYPMPPGATTPELTDSLIEISHAALVEVLPKYSAGQIQAYAQDIETSPTYSRKLTKIDGIIDWHKPAEEIEREIRAFIEWPKSRTTLAGKDVIITAAHVAGYELHPDPSDPPKPFVTPDGKIGIPSLSNGVLVIDKLKPAGKNEMSAEAFLAGHRDAL